MAASKKDVVADAAGMHSDQKNADLKSAYIKARGKALAENPNLLSTSIPEWTPGMNLDAAWKTLSFATGGQGNANPGVRQRSSLDKIAPDAPESIMPGRPVVSNAQQREKARAIGRKVSGKPLKGTVISGSNAEYDSPEYAAAAQPGGLREQERDAELPAIQKAVFGSPQVGLAAVGTAPSADFQAAVAGKGYYDTPYGRISAKVGRPGDISTPTDAHRTGLIEGLEGMGRTYNPKAKYGSKENPIYRGAFEGSQKSEYNKKPDTMDAAERKILGYTDENDGTNYSYYGPLGEGPQNKVTNPGIEKSNNSLLDQTDTLRKKYPLIFEKDSEQNKAYVAAFNAAIPNYKELNDLEKLNARTEYMSKMKDNPAYAETPPVLPSGAPKDPAQNNTIPK